MQTASRRTRGSSTTSTVEDGVVTLDLSGEIADIAGPNAVQAYAQLVFTATQYTEWR